MRTIRCLGALFLAVAFSALAGTEGPDAVLGSWITKDGKSRVEIVKDGDVYEGRIVWLKEPVYPADDNKGMAGQTKVDRENPDPVLRTRPIIGLPLIQGFRYDGDEVWADGTIYNPENGKLYKCKLTLQMDGSLKVRGYIGIPLLGETQIWTRPPADTPAPSTSN
jgi:uncharacterized protein (DUF2147 family)